MSKIVQLDTVRGCAADYDRLIAALGEYEAQARPDVGLYSALRRAADRCGYPGGISLLIWARARRRSYQSMMQGAVRELAAGIAVTNSLELAAAARIVRRRGALMYEQGVQRPGAMAAILGVLTVSIDELCAQATAERGLVVPANYNSDEQVVISGEVSGVERAMELAKDAGAKRCLPLPVSGAFHSPLMAPAVSGLALALEAETWHDPVVPVVANVNAEPTTNAAQARERLVQQLTAPVQWTRVMRTLAERHPDATFVEIGSGAVLTGLARRIAPTVRTMSVGTVADVEKFLESVSQNS
jgi:[acyl-carrier-protein] S-malonyltransferase